MKRLITLVAVLLCGAPVHAAGNDVTTVRILQLDDQAREGNLPAQVFLTAYMNGVYDSTVGIVHCGPSGLTAMMMLNAIREDKALLPKTAAASIATVLSRLAPPPCVKDPVKPAPEEKAL